MFAESLQMSLDVHPLVKNADNLYSESFFPIKYGVSPRSNPQVSVSDLIARTTSFWLF